MTVTTTINDVDIAAVAGLAGKIQETPSVASTVWKARVEWDRGFRSEARIRDFAPATSDEPAALGGTDTGPNPVEQLLGALGNCLAVGYAANATAAGITINNLSVDLEGDLDLHTFLGLNPDGNAGYEAIRVKVNLDSDASPEQLTELHDKVVGTSPVGHTLSRAVAVDIALT
ncbi:MAG: putative OsmC-like protein [Candidatus Poriferisodalaceae bacterium]